MNKRIIFCFGLVLLIASFATAQVPCGATIIPPATLSVNWPQLDFDAAHTACNPYESILSPSTVGNLTLDWQYTTQGGGGSPVVANGMAYIADVSGTLNAVDASTGAYVWSYQPDNGGTWGTAAAVANGVVYLGYEAPPYGMTSGLYAFNARTGFPLWYHQGEVGATSPTVANGVVYVDGGGGLIAFDGATGAVLWRFSAGGSLTQPVLTNGVLYAGSDEGNVYAVNASTGAPVWQLQTGAYVAVGSVANGLVYASTTAYPISNLYAFSASTGALIWKFPTKSGGPSAVARGVVYFGTGYPEDTVYALNASTGALIWKFGLGNTYVTSYLAVADGVLYFSSGGSGTDLYAVDANTGAYLWDYPGFNTSSPAVANSKVYIGGGGGVAAFHLPGQ